MKEVGRWSDWPGQAPAAARNQEVKRKSLARHATAESRNAATSRQAGLHVPDVAHPVEVLAEVLGNNRLSDVAFLLTLKARIPGSLPGQFVMLGLPGESAPLLRRPFSVLDFSPARRQLEVLYSVEGVGTELLSGVRAGGVLTLLGPLGKPFPRFREKTHVLVAGGRGIAPLVFYSKSVRRREDLVFLAGARTEDELFLLERAEARLLFVSTDDGTAGRKGTVTELLESVWKSVGLRPASTVLIGCGPAGMLKELHSYSVAKRVLCYVSLEARMACGMGVCQGCAIRTKGSRYALVCKDGPVFDSRRVDWRSYEGA